MRALLALIALAGCAEQDLSIIVVTVTADAQLTNQTPTRSWDIFVETNENALREGPTFTFLNVSGSLDVGNAQGWNDVWVDAALSSEDEAPDTVSVEYTEPGERDFALMAEYEADCVLGERCAWHYPFVLSRREGQGALVRAVFESRVFVTLGPERNEPVGAALLVEVRETTPE